MNMTIINDDKKLNINLWLEKRGLPCLAAHPVKLTIPCGCAIAVVRMTPRQARMSVPSLSAVMDVDMSDL